MTAGPQERRLSGTFRGAWRHRRWRWLVASYAASNTGDFVFSVALVVFLIDATGSAGWVAASVITRLLAAVTLSPLGGLVADRVDRRRLLVTIDAGQAVLMVVLAAVAWADGPPAVVVALAACSALASAPYRPAIFAATPALVPEDDLATANAAESVVGQTAVLVGPLFAAAILAVSDAGTAFAVNGVTFAVSALCLARIGPIGGRTARSAGFLQGITDGARVVRRDRGLVALTGFVAALVFLAGFEQVTQVLVADERLGLDPAAVGVLVAATGVGGLVTAPFVTRLGRRGSIGRTLALAGAAVGIPAALLALVSSPVLAVAILVVEGIGVIVAEILYFTLLQRACAEAVLGRVFGLQDGVLAASQLAGSVAAPVMVAGLGLEGALLVAGGLVTVVSALSAPRLGELARRTEQERSRLAPIAELLRALGIFDDLGQASLERLARASSERVVAAGEVVFHEGDAPDHLYVIRHGRCSVSTAALGSVNEMAGGDWFGEIGLLRQIPRTATVTAVDETEILVVDGTTFATVLGSGGSIDRLRSTMQARLVRTHPHLDAGG